MSHEKSASNSNVHPESSQTETANVMGYIAESLRGLQFGQLTILVQDGVVVQIERTEKRRLK